MPTTYGQIMLPKPDQKPGWFLVQFGDDIADYYRWFMRYRFSARPAFNLPLNGAHTTFIAGEKDDRLVDVKELSPYLEKWVAIEYTHLVMTNGRAFWLPAVSEELNGIRQTLGLRIRDNYHITLGNNK